MQHYYVLKYTEYFKSFTVQYMQTVVCENSPIFLSFHPSLVYLNSSEHKKNNFLQFNTEVVYKDEHLYEIVT